MFDELKQHSTAGGIGGFLPAVKQIANVAALPGIVGRVRGEEGREGGEGWEGGSTMQQSRSGDMRSNVEECQADI